LKVRKIKFNFLNPIVSLNGIPEVRGMSLRLSEADAAPLLRLPLCALDCL
jgi:hypothetical protein